MQRRTRSASIAGGLLRRIRPGCSTGRSARARRRGWSATRLPRLGRTTVRRRLRRIAPLMLGAVLAGCVEPQVEPQPPRAMDVAAGEGSAQPHLAVDRDGAVLLSWLEPEEEGHALRLATLADAAWSSPTTVAGGEDWFVNWADFPSVTPLGEGALAAHWLVYQPRGFGYDAVLSTSSDGGANWREPFPLHIDGTPTEHGFVSLFPWREGLAAVWLDGRNMIQDGEFAFTNPAGEPLGMSLRFARFGLDGERLASAELDELACDCCQTDVAFSGGDALLAYRDRTAAEVRDIVLRRLTATGWESPVALAPDHWVIEACPINGPAIDARGDRVAVAWFSAARDRPVVHVARSDDGGRTFSDALEVDSSGFGHVDVSVLASGQTAVSWLQPEADGLALVLRLISRDGEPGERVAVASIAAARPLDFPQMVYDGRRLVFAWTDFADGQRVRTAAVELR